MPNVCLVVIDGWGISPPQRFINGISTDTDAIKCANTPFMDELTCKFARQCIPLAAHGLAVGLPSGLMGNSEVGHLNIGAGRVVYQDIVRIDESMRTNSMLSVLNPALKSKRVHFIGLVSDGGVHSHQRHLSYLLDAAQNSPVDEIFIHAITDGRDTAPQSACKYFKNLFNNDLSRCPKAKVSTIIGRYYAMDRDKRWERTLLALEAFCSSNGKITLYV